MYICFLQTLYRQASTERQLHSALNTNMAKDNPDFGGEKFNNEMQPISTGPIGSRNADGSRFAFLCYFDSNIFVSVSFIWYKLCFIYVNLQLHMDYMY